MRASQLAPPDGTCASLGHGACIGSKPFVTENLGESENEVDESGKYGIADQSTVTFKSADGTSAPL